MIKNICVLFVCYIGYGSVEAQVEKQSDSTDTKVYLVVEHMPEFYGGFEEMMRFIRTNMKIPAKYRGNPIGTVYTTFTIDQEGNVGDVEVLRGDAKELNDEVIRVLRLMPKWRPGIQYGKNAKVRVNYPIRFER